MSQTRQSGLILQRRLDDTPSKGWAIHLQDVLLSCEIFRTSALYVELARVASVLRQWETCKKAASDGLELCSDDDGENDIRRQLTEFYNLAVAELKGTKKDFDLDYLAEVRSYAFHGLEDLNNRLVYSGNPSFTNLNWIQYAAMRGDIRLLEMVVSMGAAVDFTIKWDTRHYTTPHVAAPPGSTALLLALIGVAFHKKSEAINPRGYKNRIRNSHIRQVQDVLQCATALVMLGADLKRRFIAPLAEEIEIVDHPVRAFNTVGLNGRSVEEMVAIIDDAALSDAIHIMDESPLDNAWCRCGSRLPWKDCHASPAVSTQKPHVVVSQFDQTAYFRHSPVARCPCLVSTKPHYECCWFGPQPMFLDDYTGNLLDIATATSATPRPSQVREREALAAAEIISHMLPESDIHTGTPEEQKKKFVEHIRKNGLACPVNSRKSRLSEWDPAVCAGVLERMDDWFCWNDLHWQLPERELLRQVKDWNAALEVYCNDLRLVGAKRKHVVRQHTASPLTPCGNEPCDNWETQVKEYMRCSKCKHIAYCSRACQKEDWKNGHKRECEKHMADPDRCFKS